MIALQSVTAHRAGGRGVAPAALRGVSLAWRAGVLAVLGAPADGATLLLDVLAGVVSPRTGAALVDGRPPAAARARIAYVPRDVVLPEALRVDEICALAATIRGEPVVAAAQRLAPLGVEGLAGRRASTLSRAESRAVALALALASRADVLLFDDPLAGVEPSVPSRLVAALRARAAAGASVVVTTPSVRDATLLGDELAVITAGALAPVPARFAHLGRGGATLRVTLAASSGAAAVVAALSNDAAVDSVTVAAYSAREEAARPRVVVASGRDLVALAAAVGRAVVQSEAQVEAIEPAVVPLEAVRAAVLAPPAPAVSGPAPAEVAPAAPAPPPQEAP